MTQPSAKLAWIPVRLMSAVWCCHRAKTCMAAASISCTTPRPQRCTSEPVTNTLWPVNVPGTEKFGIAPELQKLSTLVPNRPSKAPQSEPALLANWSLY